MNFLQPSVKAGLALVGAIGVGHGNALQELVIPALRSSPLKRVD